MNKINLFLPYKFHYAHKKSITLIKKVITPKIDLLYIEHGEHI